MRTFSVLIFALIAMLVDAAGAQTTTPDTPAAVPEPPHKLIYARGQADLGAGDVIENPNIRHILDLAGATKRPRDAGANL
jgi:hypothetical protein